MVRDFIRKLAENVRHGIKKGAHFLGKTLPVVATIARGASKYVSKLPGIPGLIGGAAKAAFDEVDDLAAKLPADSDLRKKYEQYTKADLTEMARDATKKAVTHALKGPEKPPDTAVPKQGPKQEPAKISLPTKSFLDTSTPRNEANKLTVAKPTGLGRLASTGSD